MPYDHVLSSRYAASDVTTSTVLRNTYLLLSLTLLFSAISAGFSIMHHAGTGSAVLASLIGLGLLFATTALRNSAWGIVSIFAFTGCMGYSMGPLLNQFLHGYSNGGQLIFTALAGTGSTFFISSGYLLVTKKDLTHLGKFLMIGLVVCLIAGLLNIFLKMTAVQLAISSLMVFISTLLMMYDTSRIIQGGERNYIMATISLYLDIQVLFQNLLILLGVLDGRE